MLNGKIFFPHSHGCCSIAKTTERVEEGKFEEKDLELGSRRQSQTTTLRWTAIRSAWVTPGHNVYAGQTNFTHRHRCKQSRRRIKKKSRQSLNHRNLFCLILPDFGWPQTPVRRVFFLLCRLFTRLFFVVFFSIRIMFKKIFKKEVQRPARIIV